MQRCFGVDVALGESCGALDLQIQFPCAMRSNNISAVCPISYVRHCLVCRVPLAIANEEQERVLRGERVR